MQFLQPCSLLPAIGIRHWGSIPPKRLKTTVIDIGEKQLVLKAQIRVDPLVMQECIVVVLVILYLLCKVPSIIYFVLVLNNTYGCNAFDNAVHQHDFA